MPHPGPWITPHTTRFGGIDSSGPTDDYITDYRGDTWEDARNGVGTTTIGPTETLAPSAHPAPTEILNFLNFPVPFTRYHVAQAFSWHPLVDVDPATAFPPYTDAPPDPALPLIGVEYEDPHGTMLAHPRIEVVAVTLGGNLNLPDAIIDVYQLNGSDIGATPTYLWYDPSMLDGIAARKIGSLDSFSALVFTGFVVDPTETVVILIASAAQPVTPFPYSTAPGNGFQQFPDMGALVEYVGPRFRFIYDVAPPQRQYPRDDGLGISTRRSWPPPTSKQYGQRLGPVATYL